MALRFAKVSEEEIEEAFFYPSDLVSIKTTIPLRVGEEIDTSTLRVSIYIHHYSPPLRGIAVYYPRTPLPLQFAYLKMAEYKHQFVIIYSVDKCFELNKRSLDIRNSENEKHERHDAPCFNSPTWTSGTMHTMWGSSERNRSLYFYLYYNPQHYQLLALSRRITQHNTPTLLLSTSF